MRSQETINRAYEIVEKFDFDNVKTILGTLTRSEYQIECDNCTLYIDTLDDNDDVTIMCSDGDQYIPILTNPTDNQVKNLIKALNS